ncbi:class I SAM-dependent methyltransferase [Pandoraea sputorum]|uniref:Trans-aconitate 2-methyltransferase n=1 Tax=Pandoraea sputorum TaxID=93222 RepID=A0A5E5BH94_9BURK|nr:class I SAM-dependent methyltransferase [Pandoraea sputorum]VVE84657.1 Trans-aconitate 2-methyltransferase [Pandoraea sputorum]
MTDFDALYRASEDPWSVHTAWYEQRKRALVLASLAQPRYTAALELGCGVGQLTAPLTARCQVVHAVDMSPSAIHHCRKQLHAHGIANVALHVMTVPQVWPLQPGESVDLVLVSELAYDFSPEPFEQLLQQCWDSLSAGGQWVMCHYTPDFNDRQQATLALHAAVHRLDGLVRCVAHEDRQFRLVVWHKTKEPRA